MTYVLVNSQAELLGADLDHGSLARRVEHAFLDLGLHGAAVDEDCAQHTS